MDNIETFRERLLQDEALQRSLHHQRDVVADAFAFMTTLRSLTQTERRKERRKDGKKDSYELRHTVPPYNGLSVHLSVFISLSVFQLPLLSGVVEDGVQLGIHEPFMVRVSIKAHQPVHLQLTAPWVGPPATVDGSMSPRSSSPVVHTEGETLVVVGGCDSLLLVG